MGAINEATPAILVCGIMAGKQDLIDAAAAWMEGEYGPLILRSEPYPFTFTGYYEKEMGRGLVKQFAAVKAPVPRGILPEVKRNTNGYEDGRLDEDGNRTVNLDPGYVNLSKLVLASTKDYDHRLYLGKGIYGEITLRYQRRQKSFIPLETTYADYRTPLALDFFNRVREHHAAVVKPEALR